jgi:OOP family OmpA-OmpF porin
MHERNILLAGLLAFLLLAAFCIWHHTSGMAGTHGAAGLGGAHNANVNANLPAPRFGVHVNGGKVTLVGTVPDEAAKAALIKRANEVYGAGNYTDEIKVAPGTVGAATPDWLKWAQSLMAYGKTPNFEGSLDLNGKSLTASGLLPDEASLNKLATDLKGGVGPDVTFTNRLALRVAGAAPSPVDAKALSEEEAKLQASLNEQVKAAGVVEFAVSSAVITPQGKAVLDKLLPVMKAAGDTNVQVEGHTDNQGNADKNLTLSQQRAEAVKKYLSDNGVKAESLTAKGFGPGRPIADNSTPAGRQRNRRIEFNVVGK